MDTNIQIHRLKFESTYIPLAFLSFVVFIYMFKNLAPRWSSKLSKRYGKITEAQKIEWNFGFVSAIHSCAVCLLCLYTLAFNDEIIKEPIWCNSPLVRSICAVVAGYFIYDMLMMFKHRDAMGDPGLYVIHHGATVCACAYITMYGILPIFAVYRLFAELSTPFLNFRAMLICLGYKKDHLLYVANGLLFATAFFACRIATMPSFWGLVYSVFSTSGLQQLGVVIPSCLILPCVALDLLNVFWFHKIVSGSISVLKVVLCPPSETKNSYVVVYSRNLKEEENSKMEGERDQEIQDGKEEQNQIGVTAQDSLSFTLVKREHKQSFSCSITPATSLFDVTQEHKHID